LKAHKVNAKPSTRVRYSFLTILTGSDLSRRRLPFMAAESANAGPVVWLTACGHGDEVGGIVVIQEIFKRIRKSGLLRGAVYAFPLMNPIGFETVSRNITFSKEDLNRSFPGNKHGSLGERIADKIFTAIMEAHPTVVLDLHNDWIRSIPYALVDPDPGPRHEAAFGTAKALANQTGFLVVCDQEELKRTLSHSLLRQQVPALTLELGESYVVDEKNTAYGVKSIWNVLASLALTEPMDEPFVHAAQESYQGQILDYVDKPFSSTSGIIRFLAKPGDRVTQRQPIAKVYNAFGKLQETLTAFKDSIVLGHTDSSVVFPGMPVMAFAAQRTNIPTAAS